MSFKLIMKRKVFAVIQVLCDKYEESKAEKVATALMVNELLAEALIARGLIPKDFILKEYGCLDPISQGFTARARKEKMPFEVQKEQAEQQRIANTLSMVLDQWAIHKDNEWRQNWIKEAEKYKDSIPTAKLILDLANSKGDKTQ